ncbi:MAG: radical SAM protein [Lachnospiraceae bacterium]|nr:radical SAM protein [Lachnospiraceae bacterium]
MGFFTTAARIWLTRSFQPFTFRKEYDNQLEFQDCSNLGLYVHIPFCRSLCTFCLYCREVYSKETCNRYIDNLIQEIHLVGRRLKTENGAEKGNEAEKENGAAGFSGKKQVTSLYFGGGTPALAAERLGEIIGAVREYFIITEGIGLELHPENVTEETLLLLKEAGVTKISIGIQSFQKKFLSLLERRGGKPSDLAEALRRVPFETVSMDFIFALPGQTIDDLTADIELAFSNGANHIAIYPFIDFTFTDSKVAAMGKKEKRRLLDEVTRYCREKGYARDSIWTFSKDGCAKYSSMTRENFLGFGCSAATLLMDQFKVNTFSTEEYEKRIRQKKLPTSLTTRFTRRQRMIYYLFWAAYSTRVNPKEFEGFFGVPLKRMYGPELWLAERLGFAKQVDGVYEMTGKGAFYYHYYENYYTLSYIDQMWGTMRKEAFPEGMKF